jgi:hypothetical protein
MAACVDPTSCSRCGAELMDPAFFADQRQRITATFTADDAHLRARWERRWELMQELRRCFSCATMAQELEGPLPMPPQREQILTLRIRAAQLRAEAHQLEGEAERLEEQQLRTAAHLSPVQPLPSEEAGWRKGAGYPVERAS